MKTIECISTENKKKKRARSSSPGSVGFRSFPQRRFVMIALIAVYLLTACLSDAGSLFPWNKTLPLPGTETAWAEDDTANGPSSGDGSGQGSKIPFTLDSSSPEDGDKDVPVDVQIFLLFNKNICNVSVLENNSKCFHLTSENDEIVPVTITVPDDQVQQDHKREVIIRPKKKLKKDTSYRVSVDRTLMAKNGTNIDDAKQISFTTGKKTGAAAPAVLRELGENIQTFDSALPETDASVPHTAISWLFSDDTSNMTFLGMSLKTLAFLTALAIFVIAVMIAVLIIRRKRKHAA